jgi:hypothetical protein
MRKNPKDLKPPVCGEFLRRATIAMIRQVLRGALSSLRFSGARLRRSLSAPSDDLRADHAAGGARSIVAESLLLKHQVLILNRGRQRAPPLRPVDRVVAALCAAGIHPIRLLRCAIVLKPSTIMGFHRSLVRCKYRWLFTPRRGGKPGPKGPSPELIVAVVQMKSRNPRFGCRRIAEQLAFTFGLDLDKDVVRRVL